MAGTVTMKFSAEDAKLVRSVINTRDEIDKLERKAARLAEETKGGARQAARGNSDWKRSLVSVAAGYASLGSVLAVTKAALADINRENERAAEFARGAASRGGEGALWQIARGESPWTKAYDYGQMVKRSREMSMAGGLSLEEGADLMFQRRSLGFDRREDEWIYRLAPMMEDPASLLKGVSKVQRGFGKDEAGHAAKYVAGKIFLAAGESEVSADELAQHLAEFAQQASAIGSTDEESMAALAQVTNVTKNARKAASGIRNFADVIATGKADVDEETAAQLKSGGLIAAVRTLQSRGVAPEEFSGNATANASYAAMLAALPAIQKSWARIDTGNSQDVVGANIRAMDLSPEFRAIVEERRAQVREQVAMMPRAKRELEASAAIYDYSADLEGRELSGFGRWARMATARSAKYLGNSGRRARQLGENVGAGLGMLRTLWGGNPYDAGTPEYERYARKQQAEREEVGTVERVLYPRVASEGLRSTGGEQRELTVAVKENTDAQRVSRPRNVHVE